MLLNIAEDLKSDCKITVSPAPETKSTPDYKADSTGKKPQTMEEIEDAATKSKDIRSQFVSIQDEHDDGQSADEFDDDDPANQPQYLYMELKSTTSFKDVDVDAMLEHTTFDDFMRGLYNSRVLQQK